MDDSCVSELLHDMVDRVYKLLGGFHFIVVSEDAILMFYIGVVNSVM
jgi:hypothetical protein